MNASTLHQKICSEGENRDWNFKEAQNIYAFASLGLHEQRFQI